MFVGWALTITAAAVAAKALPPSRVPLRRSAAALAAAGRRASPKLVASQSGGAGRCDRGKRRDRKSAVARAPRTLNRRRHVAALKHSTVVPLPHCYGNAQCWVAIIESRLAQGPNQQPDNQIFE